MRPSLPRFGERPAREYAKQLVGESQPIPHAAPRRFFFNQIASDGDFLEFAAAFGS